MSDASALRALQEHDLAITRADKALEEMPEKTAILQLRKRLREIEATRERQLEYCKKADAMVARSNDEATSLQDKIDREQTKILSGDITNPKELQALTREMDALRRRKDAVEHEELALMEKAEAGREQLAKVDAVLAEGAARDAQLIEAFKKRGGELQKESAQLRKERDALVKDVPAGLLARYEALREAKHGIAVGALQGSLCSACRTQIPANKVQELSAGPQIAECPNCHRIIIVGEDR